MDDILDYIDGAWIKADFSGFVDVVSPATRLGREALSGPAKVVSTRWPKDWSREF